MKPRPRVSPRTILLSLALVIVLTLAALLWVARPVIQAQGGLRPPLFSASQAKPGTPTRAAAGTPTVSPGTPTDTAVPVSLIDATGQKELHAEGLLLFSMRDGNVSHLFAYHPLYLPLTRLTDTPWDDIHPSISPDGSYLAYSSRQNGYWDLYMLNLSTGQQSRLTDTPEYEASPSWSPDGLWIAFERYNGQSLDIYILPINEPGTDPIRLTDDPGIDRSPAWSPRGREIAFVSTRSGDEEIWLAQLDNIDDRFFNISRSPLARDRFPVWSADGQHLAWASERGSERGSGDHRLVVWENDKMDQPARLLGEGDLAAWSPDGKILFSSVEGPNQTGLAAYTFEDGRLRLPYTPLPGAVSGLAWVKGPLPGWLEETVQNASVRTLRVLWQPVLTRTVAPAWRKALVPLEDVSAPQPLLLDAVDESFNSLREQIGDEAGWDTLANLENAYLALTTPATPSIQDDWLYTGRAFALNPLLLSGGWMVISKEDYGGQTYWRVYLKARYQDGSMGMPLNEMVWDLNARFNGNPKAYEQGGQLGLPPPGYWVDLTELASRYGWERLPSWINWRTFYPSIRYNQFVITGGLDWFQAMSEVYPPEALITATPLPTHTPVVVFWTSTPDGRRGTPTPLPSATPYPNRRPTWTPLPTSKSP